MKKQKPGLIISAFIMLFALSCNSPDIYDEYKAVEKEGWYKEDTISFNPTISDTLQRYNLIINLRHNTDYKYRNVYFFTTTHFPNGDTNRDTIELKVAKKSGEWIGEGFGAIKTYRRMLLRGIRFDHKGEYVFEFCQAMREDTLQGIEDIGLQIQKFEN